MNVVDRVIRLPKRWERALSARPEAPREVPLHAGALELLVLQPSPFCNLNCDYCYLPNRGSRERMPLERLDRIMARLMAGNLVGERLSVVWHAGEPMAVPRRWYEAAFDIIARHVAGRSLTHHFQTNAVLIDAAWCEFFVRHQVRVGVSVDGPAALHDRHRRTRDGRGTHARAMQGVKTLREHGIPFHVIAVLTRESLDNPDSIFDFFAALDAIEVGFNVEEVEAIHVDSSLQTGDSDAAARRFWHRIIERQAVEPGRLRIRELAMLLGTLRDPGFGTRLGNAQNQPGQIVSVAYNGEFCFWSPELLGADHPRRGRVVLGNLDADSFDWAAMQASLEFRRWQAEIDAGVNACKGSCPYFRLCLGGAPSNKLAELGTMAGSETMACRLGLKAMADEGLAALGRQLRPSD